MPNLLPIGRFSRSCRLSIKSLRHYDQLGLLRPAHIDRETGYRYYDASQAPIAVAISMLRALDVPLAAIRRLVEGTPEEISEVLDEQRRTLERELAKKELALSSIRRLIAEKALLPYRVKVRHEPDRRMIKMSMVSSSDKLVADTTELIYRFFDAVQRVGLPIADPVLGRMWIDDPEERLRCDILLPIDEGAPLPEGAELEILAGGPVAWTLHTGAYEVVGLAHHSVFAWVQEHGHKMRGEVLERYVNDPRQVAIEELQTEVMMPLEED